MKLLISLVSIAALCGAAEVPIRLDAPLRVPLTTLPAGAYTFSVADSLPDRKIIRVKDSTGRVAALFIAAPNPAIPRTGGSFTYWPGSTDGVKRLRAWHMAGETAAEAVYGKEEALAITKETGQPVPAIDPESELSKAELSRQQGLSAESLAILKLWSLDYGPVAAQERKLAAGALTTVGWRSPSGSLPQTASGNAIFMIGGLALLLASRLVRK